MSTMGPLCPEQLTQEETLEDVCVGPKGGSRKRPLSSASFFFGECR